VKGEVFGGGHYETQHSHAMATRGNNISLHRIHCSKE